MILLLFLQFLASPRESPIYFNIVPTCMNNFLNALYIDIRAIIFNQKAYLLENIVFISLCIDLYE